MSKLLIHDSIINNHIVKKNIDNINISMYHHSTTYLLLGQKSACVGKVPGPGEQHHSTIKLSQQIKPVISHLQIMHATTEPWRPTNMGSWCPMNEQHHYKGISMWSEQEQIYNLYVFCPQSEETKILIVGGGGVQTNTTRSSISLYRPEPHLMTSL